MGRAAEDECPGALNTGMFAAMVETGSVMGVFVGHDHDNDYVVAEKGIALGYGRFSGDDTTYNNGIISVLKSVILELGTLLKSKPKKSIFILTRSSSAPFSLIIAIS